ncbi:MAG: hypothetical protein V3R66_08010 [Rhodospirillales bacterium]
MSGIQLFTRRRLLVRTGGLLGAGAFAATAFPFNGFAADDGYAVRGFYTKPRQGSGEDGKLVAVVFDRGEKDIDVWTDYVFKERPLGVTRSIGDFLKNLKGENSGKLTKIVDMDEEGKAYTLEGLNAYQSGGVLNLKPSTKKESGGDGSSGGSGGSGGGDSGGGGGGAAGGD